ncbi:hypothetical protein [Roseobacter sp. HKCCD7120]|uniref:hypothetical protein n=4 Tax=Roseobacter TaxID=2433 RepID=UPI001555C3D8|nr:hypothetical protein [Roseobacter sp. HKCCD7120]NPU44377.1 hypothetical protein [Roseobacter sp. HKCCD7120]
MLKAPFLSPSEAPDEPISLDFWTVPRPISPEPRERCDACLRESANITTSNWRHILRRQNTLSIERSFMIADPHASVSRQLAGELAGLGYDVDICDDSDAAFGSLTDQLGACRWSLLLIDLDFLQNSVWSDEIVGDLLELRQSVRDLPCILVSDDFGRDDRGTGGLPIADARLRAPATLGRLKDAIREAQANNLIWQRRADRGRVEADIEHGSRSAMPNDDRLDVPTNRTEIPTRN